MTTSTPERRQRVRELDHERAAAGRRRRRAPESAPRRPRLAAPRRRARVAAPVCSATRELTRIFQGRRAPRRPSSDRWSPTSRRTAWPATAPASRSTSLCTTPVSVTRPCSTTMWIGGFGHDRVVPEVRVAVDRPRDPVAQLRRRTATPAGRRSDRRPLRTPSTSGHAFLDVVALVRHRHLAGERRRRRPSPSRSRRRRS